MVLFNTLRLTVIQRTSLQIVDYIMYTEEQGRMCLHRLHIGYRLTGFPYILCEVLLVFWGDKNLFESPRVSTRYSPDNRHGSLKTPKPESVW